MKKLAGIIEVEPKPGAREQFNDWIPSGYTYFLQLIAHDLVESSLFLSRSEGSVLGLSNVRSKPLRLETIFGGGPIQCPFAYNEDKSGFRNRLRLGEVRKDGKFYTGNTDDLRDIARARATEVLGENSYPEALIADGRNDSHAILSQIVVMFHHLQNQLLESLDDNPKICPTGSHLVNAQRKFVAGQSACALIYRSIIRNDILSKILHPGVFAEYESGRITVLDPPQGLDTGTWLVPLEFSFGFFRFGHAMIRSVYSFNPRTEISEYRGLGLPLILEHTSEKNAGLMPFEEFWTIDWQRFFGSDPATTNFSVPIGPWSRLDIEGAARGQDTNEPGLTFRDLTSSIATQPWSVRALAERLSPTHGKLLQLSPFLRGPLDTPKAPPWYADISRWLSERRSAPETGQHLDDNDIRILATDPPIPFFARFEAGLDPGIAGKHLGVLTSIVVADVFYGIFQHDRLLDIDGNWDLAAQLRRLSEILFDGKPDAFSGAENVTTVERLIDFLGARIEFPTGG
ncbi:hypothetical protein [Bradyrhizobium prioriisuperbiae]|uniref:hypothetical protein n=1 Tax=Bradyrhizobium prioriisuperbiae TaxID=2854389 RepID=UPI0028EF3884|nr:hypothetical protein [Bradyrhizobium prioritasuperba]